MTFGQLEIFVALAESKGFTAAALRLGISQPAVSSALKTLEEEFGAPLFDRAASPIRLTPLGQRLQARAREILGLADTMRREALAYRGMQTGSLRIGSFGATSSVHILPQLLDRFCAKHPEIDVFVEEGADEDVIRWIEERRVDLGFVVLPDERFQTWPVAEDQFVALVGAGSPLAGRCSVALRDLCDAPFIMPETNAAGIIQNLFTQARLSPNVRFRTSQVMSTINMVARGQGISVVADMVLPPQAKGAGWVKIPLSPTRNRLIGLAMHQHAPPSPAALAFAEMATKR